MRTLDILLAPAEFAPLPERDLTSTTCVVFDVLRATTTMLTALANGAEAIVPVAEIADAIALHIKRPDVLLAGERDGLRISAGVSGGIEFHLGNSPREFTPARVAGHIIVATTTNGTRALRACAHAKCVLIGAMVNLTALANEIRRRQPANLLLICAGTGDEAAYEDALAAGGLCDLLWDGWGREASDAAWMARRLFKEAKNNLCAAMGESRNGRRLLANPDLAEDVAVCSRLDSAPLVAALNELGEVRLLS